MYYYIIRENAFLTTDNIESIYIRRPQIAAELALLVGLPPSTRTFSFLPFACVLFFHPGSREDCYGSLRAFEKIENLVFLAEAIGAVRSNNRISHLCAFAGL